jgi:hypothetical protein
MIHQFRALAINEVAVGILDEVIIVQIFCAECALVELFLAFVFFLYFCGFALIFTLEELTTSCHHLLHHFCLSLL